MISKTKLYNGFFTEESLTNSFQILVLFDQTAHGGVTFLYISEDIPSTPFL